MRVRIHRGAHEIGGTCIEVESLGSRIVLDVGRPLDAERNEDVPLPPIAGLATGSDHTLAGLFISHGHQDHWGLVDKVSTDVPLYMGEASAAILREGSFFSDTPQLSPTRFLTHRQELEVGPFKVTPYLNDHSGFDTYSLLIESDGCRLLYSADLQGHGRKSAIFQEFLRKPPPDVDVLLMEGTNVFAEGQSKEAITEKQVEADCVKAFRATKGAVLAIYSAQNLDRLVTLYRAAKRSGRLFVMDLYVATIARACGNPNIPQADWEDVRVYVPNSQRVRIKQRGEFERLEWISEHRIFPEDIEEMASKLVMTFRSSMAREFEKARCFKGALAIWSLWPGYLTSDSERRLLQFLELNQIPMEIHHSSGHAFVEDLQRYAQAVGANRLVPIHSAAPERFAQYFENVDLHPDGEWWEVRTDDQTPGRLVDVQLGGFGPMWSVRLEGGGSLHYSNHGWSEDADLTLTVSDDAWMNFVQECDRLKIWNWKSEYEPAPEHWATDLASWEVTIREESRMLSSSGYGAFPRSFNAFVRALGELAGGVEIR